MRHVLRGFGSTLGWLLLSVLALVVSALFSTTLPVARRVAAAFVSDVASREMKGTLTIGTFSRLSADALGARNLVLFDAQGRRVVEADHMVVKIDLAALVDKRLHFVRARLDHATARLFDDGTGLPTLFSCFDSQTPPKPGEKPGEPLHVAIDGIRIAHLELTGELLGLQNLLATDIKAAGSMTVDRDVHVRIDRAQGTIVQPFGFVAGVDDLSGTISTVASEGVWLKARTHRDSERANADIRFASGWLGLEIDADRVSSGTLRGLGYDWMPQLTTPLSGHLSIAGPLEPTALHLKAALTTDAGPAQLDGDIDASSGVLVTIQSEGLELDRLVVGYPKVHARGLVRIANAKDDVAPRIHVEVEPLIYSTIAVPGFKIDGALTDIGLRIDRLDAQSKGGRVSGKGRIGNGGAFELRLHVAFADIASDANLRRFWPDAHARLDADLHVASAQLGQGELNFDGRIALTDLRYGLTSAKKLELRGSARGDPQQPRVELNVTGSEIRVGSYLLGDPSLRVTGGPRAYAADGQFVAAGKRTFNVSAKIVATEQGFEVNADPIELSVGESSWRGALEALKISDAAVELGALRLASRAQRLEAHGILRFAGDDALDAELQDFDLTALGALLGEHFPLRHGYIDTSVSLRGDIERPELKIQGALREGALYDLEGVNALYLVTYKAGALALNGEVDLGVRGLVDFDGSGKLDARIANPLDALRTGEYDVKFESQSLALSLVPSVKRAGIEGGVSGSVRVRGALFDPTLEASLSIDSLSLPGYPSLSVLLDSSYQKRQLQARIAIADERGQLATGDAKLQLDWRALLERPDELAQLGVRGPWQIAGHLNERRLDQWPGPIARAFPYALAISGDFELHKTSGASAGAIHFAGHFVEPLAGSPCAIESRPALDGDLELANGLSRFWLELANGDERLARVDGTLDTPLDRWLEAQQFERPTALHTTASVSMQKIERVPYACGYGSGALEANLALDGGLSLAPALLVRVTTGFLPITLTEDRRKQLTAPSCTGDPIRVQLELRADKAALKGTGQMQGCHGGATALEFGVPVNWDRFVIFPAVSGNAPLSAHVRFDGSQLRPLFDRIPGVMNGNVIAFGQIDLSGTPQALRWDGKLDLNHGGLYLIGMGQELSAISARLVFQGDWAKLEHFQAEVGNGRLEAAGGFGFHGLLPDRARVALLATKLPIKREGIDIAWINGSAAVDAEITADHTHAAVQLQSLDARLPDTSNRVLQALEANPDVDVITQKPVIAQKPYPIELSISGKRRLNVVRNDFNAAIATELAISYRDPDLQVGGYISFGSGEFEIFGKRFTINNGALRFDPTRELDPDVFLLATQKPEAAGVSPVTLTVTGTLSDPKVTFSSDVCPGETGAITYLVSGACAAGDPDMIYETTQTQAAFASGLVGGILTLGAQKQLRGLVPRFSVESTSSGSRNLKAGFSSESLIPKFMRKLVRRVYVEGGVYTPKNDPSLGPVETTTTTTLQFLLELYFPYNFVGSGRVAPQNWGVDLLWEP